MNYLWLGIMFIILVFGVGFAFIKLSIEADGAIRTQTIVTGISLIILITAAFGGLMYQQYTDDCMNDNYIICQECGDKNDKSTKFCKKCGEKIEEKYQTCPECNCKCDKDTEYCKECGQKLTDDKYSYCSKCNHRNDKESNFCEKCGKKLKKQEDVE